MKNSRKNVNEKMAQHLPIYSDENRKKFAELKRKFELAEKDRIQAEIDYENSALEAVLYEVALSQKNNPVFGFSNCINNMTIKESIKYLMTGCDQTIQDFEKILQQSSL